MASPRASRKISKRLTASASTIDTISPHLQLKIGGILPDPEQYHHAPEIAHLKIQRRIADESGVVYAAAEDNFNDPDVETCFGCKCKGCFGKIISKCNNCLRRQELGDVLDDLDPVAARTNNSLEFIRRLIDTKPSKSQTSQKSNAARLGGIKKGYKAAYEGLLYLHHANDILKQLIILLTFTRYADEPLSEAEQSLTHAKTVIGSYAWMTTYALQQLQFDPDVEINGYPALDLKEVIKSMENLVCQTVYMWQALIHTIETVEMIHQKAEHVFHTLVNSFPESKDCKIATTRHIKVYRKFQRRTEELEKLKHYDPHKAAQTWARFSFAPLRILYKDDSKINTLSVPVASKSPKFGKAPINWTGFDMLTTPVKFSVLKLLQHDISQICLAVLEQLEKIDKVLHNNTNSKEFSLIRCFEDGFILLGQYLHQVPTDSWSHQEILDFLEVDRITLDSLDLLTLSTATIRTLLHEARHIFHITYETTRDLDYLECKVMNTYEEIVSSCQHDFGDWAAEGTSTLPQRPETISTRKSKGSKTDKKKASAYDIEETDIEPRDAESKFERSIYQDILKELPIFCNGGRIALTLQDAEAVFSESSHDMLSAQVHG